jgi:hypothetical protein
MRAEVDGSRVGRSRHRAGVLGEGPMSKIFLHFTNHKVSWGGNAPWKSTGFVESILENGLRRFANVGTGDVVDQLVNFIHHGMVSTTKKEDKL